RPVPNRRSNNAPGPSLSWLMKARSGVARIRRFAVVVSAPSRAADQNPGGEHENPANYHLKGGRKEWRIHKAVADIGDGEELHRDHGNGDDGRRPEIGNEIRERVAQAAERGHEPANSAAHEGSATPGQRAVVRERLGEPH